MQKVTKIVKHGKIWFRIVKNGEKWQKQSTMVEMVKNGKKILKKLGKKLTKNAKMVKTQ